MKDGHFQYVHADRRAVFTPDFPMPFAYVAAVLCYRHRGPLSHRESIRQTCQRGLAKLRQGLEASMRDFPSVPRRKAEPSRYHPWVMGYDHDDTDADDDYEGLSHGAHRGAATPRGRRWLRYLMDPEAVDPRPVLAEMEALGPARAAC